MMKKTTSALAVAALLGTGAASAATFQVNDDTSITIGGDIQYAYYDVTDDAGDSSTDFTDNGSSLVFAGEQTHSNGVTTSFYLDLDNFGTLGGANSSNTVLDDGVQVNTGSNTITDDEYHVAFAGDFGEIKVGNEGDVGGSAFDVVDIAEGTGLNVPEGGASTEVVQYYSNAVNGISFAVQTQIAGDEQQGADGSSTSFGGYVEGDFNGITLGLAYDERANDGDEPTYAVMAGTAIGGVNLTANHVVQDDGSNNEQDETFTAVAADYGYGAGSVYGTVQSYSIDNLAAGEQDDFTQYLVGVNYSVTPNAYVYGELSSQDRENDQNDTTLVGLVYSW